MNFIKKRRQLRFEPAIFEEDTSYLQNPSCGWYRIYPFAIEEEQDFEELYWCLCPEETLALALVDIGAFRDEPLSEDALQNLAGILGFFRKHDKEIILRITYDREGRGMEREPDFLNTVIGHMQQLGAVIRAYREQILVVQGMLAGSWGEMHDSKFLSEERLKRLMHIWQEALGEIAAAVRTPQQWRLLHPEGTVPGKDRIGLFNDGMFGSPDHLGTYGWQRKEEAGWRGRWSREEEISFTGKIASAVPYGGEAVGESLELTFQDMVEEMRRTKTCYLNSVHDVRRLNQWKEALWGEAGVWEHISVFDYIGCHLGYRFVVRKAELAGKKELYLRIYIENTGFSTLKEEAELLLCVESEGEPEYMVLPESLCGIEPQETKEITAGLSRDFIEGLSGNAAAYPLSLAIRRKRDKHPIFFANTHIEEGRVKLGLFTNG